MVLIGSTYHQVRDQRDDMSLGIIRTHVSRVAPGRLGTFGRSTDSAAALFFKLRTYHSNWLADSALGINLSGEKCWNRLK